VSSDPIRLKAICRGSGLRLFLDGAELWQGLTLLGVVSGEWLASVVTEKLDQLALMKWTKAELAAAPNRPLGPPLRKPPAPLHEGRGLPPSREIQAARRSARGRRRRPHPPPRDESRVTQSLPRPGKV
jgi:hypothetical protein